MVRALLVLVLSAVVVAMTASVAVRLVSDEPVPSSTPVTGLVWAGHVFTSKEAFAEFLRSRGASYDAWAARHPGAAPWMRVRNQPPIRASSPEARTAAPAPAPPPNRAKPRLAPPVDAASAEEPAARRPAPAARVTAAPPPARPQNRTETRLAPPVDAASAEEPTAKRPAPAARQTAAPPPARPPNRAKPRLAPPVDAASADEPAARRPAPVARQAEDAQVRRVADPAPVPASRRSELRDAVGVRGAPNSAAATADAPVREDKDETLAQDRALAASEPTAASSVEAALPSLVGGLLVAALGLGMMTMFVLVVRFLRGTWNP